MQAANQRLMLATQIKNAFSEGEASAVRFIAYGDDKKFKQVEKALSEAVEAMRRGTGEVTVGANVVCSAGKSFKEIAAFADEVTELVKEIAINMRHLSSGSSQVVAAMREDHFASRQITGRTEGISAASNHEAAALEQITRASQPLICMADKLQNAVNKFKL